MVERCSNRRLAALLEASRRWNSVLGKSCRRSPRFTLFSHKLSGLTGRHASRLPASLRLHPVDRARFGNRILEPIPLCEAPCLAAARALGAPRMIPLLLAAALPAPARHAAPAPAIVTTAS